jgi:transposase InsO family protein
MTDSPAGSSVKHDPFVGPFPRARGGYRFLIVVIDTFTEWVEAEPIGRITKENTVKFLWSIVMCFGVPHRILSDNGTQFTSKKFENFCERLDIKHYQSLVYHSMTNGLVECANDIILQGIKTHIFDRLSTYNKKWIEELPTILWAVCTTAN